MTFSLVFLLKMYILHFYDHLKNKGGYPTLYFAFCNLHEQTSNIYKEWGKLITLTKKEQASLIWVSVMTLP